MWWFGRSARRARLLRRSPIEPALWASLLEEIPVLHGLGPDEVRHLHDATVVLAHEIDWVGCGGFEVGERERLVIAAQAALLTLGLGVDALQSVGTVLVYPAGFRTRAHREDELGVVHEGGEDLLGEAWYDGPVVLNWEDVDDVAAGEPFNLVLHEFAHKLDMLDGYEDGVPPLHRGMDRGAWEADFAAARAELARLEADGHEPAIDPYAAEDEAEGFAVFTETFFAAPDLLRIAYPKVYDHLRAFYRQDPIVRFSGA
ncbi:MAG: zinc-dependent peptidase [Planctomycetota bacterium]|nr:zinc-dependent peptidase [Planctomycetota bacterium]MDA0932680.1 zinc-dependent peptidase [Planctomycetota bacterium]MDA1221640.1 zinc-dependent peptidase [Planctomycetota bacterium]